MVGDMTSGSGRLTPASGPHSDKSTIIGASDFDVSSMPASRLLSPNEKKLCASLRLKPSQYIHLKTLIIKVS